MPSPSSATTPPPPSGQNLGRPDGGTPRRSLGTWRNLFISMALLGLIVAAWLALVPRVERVEQPAVDVVTTTRQVARDSGTPLWVADPGEDWKATNVRVDEPKEGVQVLRAGYLRQPEGQAYVEITQTLAPTSAVAAQTWVSEQYRVGDSTTQAGALVWARGSKVEPSRNALIGPFGVNPIIVVAGTEGYEELARFAETLRPVALADAVPSPGRSTASAG